MQEKIYECECGKTFSHQNALNAHKGKCKTILEPLGKWDDVYMKLSSFIKSGDSHRAKQKLSAASNKEFALEKWIREQHQCEKCKKLMIHKYGSGRYCSKSCANSHIRSEESKLKTSNTLKNSVRVLNQVAHKENLEEYLKHPAYCEICNIELSWDQRNRKTCGKNDCFKQLLSKRRKDRILKDGYNLNVTVKNKYKYGTYAGISCDSSWELAFVLYCLDYKLPLIRNRNDFFTYMFENIEHKFYPDFKLDDTYIEIKGQKNKISELKAACIPDDIKFRMLYKEDIKPYIDYAVANYGENFTELYDRNYPSWMDKIS